MSHRKTTEEFIKESNIIHNRKYDYSKVNYINAYTKVCIICPIHGEFWQEPHSHLKGCGCIACGKNKVSLKKTKTTEEFINKSKIIHNNKYEYSEVQYVNVFQKVKIICPIHGEFWQTPNIHLRGCGCEKCGGRFVKDTKTFIEEAQKVHGNKYDYSKTNYKDCKTKLCIICSEHGEFWQTSPHHLNGEGCPSCARVSPKAEKEIISLIEPIYAEQHNRKILNGKEIDIYIPSLKIGIEFNGLLWHSEKYGKNKHYHEYKTYECNSNGIGLITIFEDEWVNKRKVCEYKLNHILGKINSQNNETVKCIFKELKDKNVINNFLQHNTLLNKIQFSFAIGAFCNEKLISLLLLKKYNNKFIIKCLSSSIDYTEYNFEEDLFNYFISNYTFKELIFFAKNEWLCNRFDNFYTKHGFKIEKNIPPKIMYFNRKIAPYKKFSKQEYLNNNPDDINWISVWDCGSIKYSLKNS